MTRTCMRHAAAVTILAAMLALAAPARALAGPEWARASDSIHAVWSWLVGLLSTPVETHRPPARPGPVWEKEGGCIDPSGRPVAGCATQSGTAGGPGGR
jgi:hypothetical protein